MTAPTPAPSARSARPRVFLHVGAAKSGTTYLQNVLWHNRARLLEHGVLYPGGDDVAAHVKAAFDLRKVFFPGAVDPTTGGAWAHLVAQARAHPGDSIISQELFAPALRPDIARALADLDFADVHLVFTARDLARQIPAHWQEDIKNRFTTSFAEFTEVLRRPDWREHEVARLFWPLQDPVEVLERWAEHLPRERVHLITLPRPGAPRDLLWKRFCQAVGLDPGSCDLSGSFANPSLGLAETQLLLRVNQALDHSAAPWPVYNEHVKHYLAQQVLTARRSAHKIRLPAADHAWAAERGAQMVADLRAADYPVIGDLDELLPDPPPADADARAPHPDDPCWDDIADAAGDAVTALLRRLLETEQRVRDTPGAERPAGEQLRDLGADAERLRAVTGTLVHDSKPMIKRAVRTMSERSPAVSRMREAYWRLHAVRTDPPTDPDPTSTR
ncbi:hypothetical protein ACQEU3_20885 [Spirillospora sp. CA-253888]